jgi:hypothetical protein
LKAIAITIDELESFLLLIPFLVYLKLIDGEKIFDGKRSGQWIKINLPQLDKFEFYFRESRRTEQNLIDLELIIASFQIPFWIEHNK